MSSRRAKECNQTFTLLWVDPLANSFRRMTTGQRYWLSEARNSLKHALETHQNFSSLSFRPVFLGVQDPCDLA
jgi:hypothetical protein